MFSLQMLHIYSVLNRAAIPAAMPHRLPWMPLVRRDTPVLEQQDTPLNPLLEE
jgi:hypothetical protein